MRLAAVLVLCGLSALTSFGQTASTAPRRVVPVPEPKKVEPREVDLSDHKLEFNKDAKLNEPLKLTSAGDIKLSPLSVLGSNLKADLKTEYVLLFQWQGSGKDALEMVAETKNGKSIVTFTLKPGTTRDLRPHSKAFVLPAGAEWKVAK